MAQQIAIIADTTDPINTLQVQFYTPTVNVISQAAAIPAIQAQIADYQAAATEATNQANALQALLDTLTTALTNAGATDLTKPLTSAQITALAAAGINTTGV